MRKSDGSSAAQTARISSVEEKTMPGTSDPYIREQLEKRREELTSAMASPAGGVDISPFEDLLQEVGSAIERIDRGTFGICDECHDTIEKERLIADPLVRLCLDHLTDAGRRALERDIELAARIQRGLLPQADVRFRDWRIQYQYNPAGMVSGDYCDLISPAGEGANGEGKLIFLLGDVAGKGVAASLLMTHLHAMFRSLAGLGLEFDKLLETANGVFCESTIAGQYATLICGRAGRQGEIEIASAGHFPALLVAKDGVRQVSATGLPLGMFSTSRYTVQRVRLEPGDSLLLYTDGISEANNAEGKEYGVSGLMRVAGERHGWAPHELLAACLKDVQKFSSSAPPADDQTLMIIHRTDSAGFSLGE
jgi:sigma-B regulation protein RsbU (phosphoserine phosphatase)